MPFTVEDFHDLVRLLEERPEWRSELRRLVLTDQLLALPEQVAELRAYTEQRFQDLAAAQQRTEERLTALAAAQQRTEERLTALAAAQQRTEERLTALVAAQQRTEERLTALAAAQQRTQDQLTAVEERLTALAAAQQRTQDQLTAVEERLTALAAAQQRTQDQLTAVEERLTALAAAQQRTQDQLTAVVAQLEDLVEVVRTLSVDLGDVKGKSLESEYRTKVFAYFSRIVRRAHALSSDELMTLLEDAIDSGTLAEEEAEEIALADVIVRGRRRSDGVAVLLVVEVSWGVGQQDVERAVHRAGLLARTGIPTVPVVAGTHVTSEAASLARQHQVWQVTNGQTIRPE